MTRLCPDKQRGSLSSNISLLAANKETRLRDTENQLTSLGFQYLKTYAQVSPFVFLQN